jgi:hypothetical protein
MWTTSYKGYFIHGWFYRDDFKVTKEGTNLKIHCKSIHTAKCIISRYIRLNTLHL